MKSVDVIIPVYKPREEFKKLIKLLCMQTVVPDKIILVQTVADDYAGELLKVKIDNQKSDKVPYVEVRAVNASEFDHGGTRNLGASYSDADYILFMTQDAVPKNKYLIENLLLTFNENYRPKDFFSNNKDAESENIPNRQNAISYARQLPRKEADLVERMTREYNYPDVSRIKYAELLDELGIHTYFCSDVCAMYDRKIFEELGGFVSPTTFNEDMIMAATVMDHGYNVTYCAEARVIHSHSYKNMEQLRRNFDMGVSQKMYNEIFSRVSSEKTGSGYALSLIKKLLKAGKPVLAFNFALSCGFKLAGYKLGKNYDKLPKPLIMKFTLNKNFWKKK
ncbi:MAG: glycosyltransferase family 2 protein [Lachnospiraceae bacterium]|nr:glycosyltransferase family 2 protein [Lachnospiraceae bacterium]